MTAPASAPDFAIVVTGTGRLTGLRETLPAAAAQPNARVVVVECVDPDEVRGWGEQQHFPNVVVVRVPGQSRYNASAARNAGAAAVPDASWLCFIDADVALDPTFIDTVRPLLGPDRFLVPDPPTRDLFGICIVPRVAFDRVGGYDDAIPGGGGEDFDLSTRLKAAGLTEHHFPAGLLHPIPRHDAAKPMGLSHFVNRLYVAVKFDLAQATGNPTPTARVRNGVYGVVRDAVLRMASTRQPVEFRVTFRVDRREGWPGLTSDLFYTVRPDPLAPAPPEAIARPCPPPTSA